MDTTDAAFEADVELDGEALIRHEPRELRDRGQRASGVAKGGIDIPPSPTSDSSVGNVELEDGETSPLLQRRSEEDRRPYPDQDDFSNLPWHKRPSIFWVLGPFSLVACAFGGVITPKLNLILELICKEYISERQMMDPGFTLVPVDFNNGDNDQCRIREVQARVAEFTLWGSLIAGLLSAITSPKLGALSDRYGRKRILVFTSIGTVIGEIVTICAATYPETFPVDLLLIGYAADGLTGSFIVAMAISNSYATDCTPPARRNVAFGCFHGCLFTGIAIGPIVAGYLVEATGKIVTIFYVLLAVHIFFITFIALFVPESLTEKRQMLAREKYSRQYEQSGAATDWLTTLNLFQPLTVLWPTGPGSSSALRRNLFFLAAVDTIVFGVAMGSLTVIVIYTNYMFGWKSFESGRFLSIVNASRVFGLVVVMPILTRMFRRRPDKQNKDKNSGCDTFDLSVIRFSVLFDTLGYVGYSLARTGPMMILSGVVAALGGMGAPTLQSALTKHVPSGQTGQLLGASGLLHALARVVAPIVFNKIYAKTVGKFTQTVFVCLAATFGLAFLITWALKPNVYFDEEKAAEAANDPNYQPDEQHSGREHIPIVGSVMALFGVIAAFFTSGSSN